MKKWLWIPVVTLVLTSAAAFVVAYHLRSRQVCTPVAPLQNVALLQKELHLTDAQATEIKTLTTGLSKKMDACCEAHCAARFELSKQLALPVADTNKAAHCVAQMCDAQNDGERATLDYLLKVRALLTPDQQKRYATLLNEQLCTCPMNQHEP
jgi:Spy/CpxP family protein refolding chaperone